ncbi:hypothetical protein CC80DRAFT_506044 [Byssothecium circinans]|uniref:Uncharacterized protein n=1 Tax=Byssothecium circinans TaxID=147558 RepID=A0A6A5TQV2_9PLEO|nr:hypothetical protein CC80DRAFT_506044 [Byssothecium circinans]
MSNSQSIEGNTPKKKSRKSRQPRVSAPEGHSILKTCKDGRVVIQRDGPKISNPKHTLQQPRGTAIPEQDLRKKYPSPTITPKAPQLPLQTIPEELEDHCDESPHIEPTPSLPIFRSMKAKEKETREQEKQREKVKANGDKQRKKELKQSTNAEKDGGKKKSLWNGN